jgi:hypothetical protein
MTAVVPKTKIAIAGRKRNSEETSITGRTLY